MSKFIILTHDTEAGEKLLVNLRYLVGVIEDHGKTVVSLTHGAPAYVKETVDEIMARIEHNTGNVI